MYLRLFLQALFIIANCIVLIRSGISSKRNKSDTSSNNNDDECLISSGATEKFILGAYRESENGVEYCVYLGIPYAQPPIGELRFKPPQSMDFLYDLLSIYKSSGPTCISKKMFGASTINQNEDCLYLNIFIPLKILRSIRKNAVVVWIHGGSYNVGSGLSDMDPTHGPESYVENDMIFVSFNYRLGPLGFLRVPELNITGNYGLMDQRFAFKWIHRNIHLWNGDPKNVTVMGWSAGSSSVSYHLLARESNQYFKRAILMSGTLLNPWAHFDHPAICLKQLLITLQIERRNISRLLTINGNDFERDLSGFFTFGSSNFCFVPTVDHIVVGDTLDFKLHKNIDIMIGWTSLESQHFDLQWVRKRRDFYKFTFLNLLIHMREKVHRLSNYLENEFYKKADKYLDTNTVDWASNDTAIFYRLASKLISVMNLKYGVQNYVKKLLTANRHTDLNIFVYQFSYDGKFFMNHNYNDGLLGAEHGDDVAYMFRTEQNLRAHKNNYDVVYRNELFVQRALLKMWTNFMKQGNPTPIGIIPLANEIEGSLVWENYNLKNQLLDINLPIKMVPNTDDAFYHLSVQIENCIQHDVCSFLND